MTQIRWWMSAAALLTLTAAASARQPGDCCDLSPLARCWRAFFVPNYTPTAQRCACAAALGCVGEAPVCVRSCGGPVVTCHVASPAALGCVCGGAVATAAARAGCCPACKCPCCPEQAEDRSDDGGEFWERFFDLLEDVFDLLCPFQTWAPAMELPSGRYLDHTPQYFPPSPPFPLSCERAQPEAVWAQAPPPGVVAPVPPVYWGTPGWPGTQWSLPNPYPPGAPPMPWGMIGGSPYPMPMPPMAVPPMPTAEEVHGPRTVVQFVTHDGKGRLETDSDASKGECLRLDLKVAGKTVKLAAGKSHVLVSGDCFKAHADKVVSDHCGKLILEGGVRVECHEDGKSCLLKADKIVIDLSHGRCKCAVQGDSGE